LENAEVSLQLMVLPRDFPPVSTVQRYFYAWRDSELWSTINHLLLLAVRLDESDSQA